MLIRLLQEASSLGIVDLKKAVQRDKRAAPVLKKDLKLDDIADKEQFLASVKYHIFNNEAVRDFVKQRHAIKDVTRDEFDELRKLRATELDAAKLQQLADFVQLIFKEHASVERLSLSRELKAELNDWFNRSGRYYNLKPWAMNELDSVPGLKPTRRTLVYRGLLFSEGDLQERTTYDGTLEVGNGLKFLRSIRKGKRTVDLEWDRPSSWTKSVRIAERFAQYGPASSNFGATLQWLEREMKKKHIDGALGFVISTFVEPEHVLIDTDRFNASFHMRYGDEGEVILKPGTYTCRIVKKYTVDAGEVDPDAEESVDTAQVKAAIEQLSAVLTEVTLPEWVDSMLSDDRWGAGTASWLLKDIDIFKRLVVNGTTTLAHHAHDKITEAFKTTLANLDPKLLKPELYADDPALGRQVKLLKKIVDKLNSPINHSKFAQLPRGKGPMHELSSDEYRTTIKSSDVLDLEKPLLTQGRFTDRRPGLVLTALAQALGVDLPSSAQLHMFGAAKQAEIVDGVIDALFKKLDMDKHEDRGENIKTLLTLLKKAYRNWYMLSDINRLKKNIQEMSNVTAA